MTTRPKFPLFSALILPAFITLIGAGLFALRFYRTGNIHYIFLVWNTFLAWLPLLFVAFAWRWQHRRWFALPYLGLWLLFIPNEQIFSFINETDRSIVDEAMEGKTILCSPLSLYAILAVIRQSIDSFRLESKSREMLSLFGTFRQQWEKFKEQMETVKTRFESVHKGYEELIGTRERQLEKPLEKIEQLRMDQNIPSERVIEDAFEKVTTKRARQIESTVR